MFPFEKKQIKNKFFIAFSIQDIIYLTLYYVKWGRSKIINYLKHL